MPLRLGNNSVGTPPRFLPGERLSHLIQLLLGKHLTPYTGDVQFTAPTGEPLPFTAHYQTHIQPKIADFEEKRLRHLQKLRKRLMIAVPLFPLLLAAQLSLHMMLGANNAHDAVLGISLMIYAGLGWWSWGPIRDYKSAIKSDIFPLIFKYFDRGSDWFEYSEEGKLSVAELEPSGIIPSYDRAHLEDYVEGYYKEVALELEEAKLTETRGSGKNRRTVTTFKGLFIRLSMNKNFNGHTLLKRDRGAIGNWLGSKFANGGKERVALEDPEFEKKFEVYSTDQVEARYLLTTSFMERLLQLSRIFDNAALQAAFYDNCLLLLIPSREDRFETSSIFSPATFEEDIRTILAEMEQIFQIIEILKLYQQTRL